MLMIGIGGGFGVFVLVIDYYFLTAITIMQGKENANPNNPYLFDNTRLNKQIKDSQYGTDRPTCRKHNEEIGRLFCQECLIYNLCAKCCQAHEGHTIRKFQNWSQAKQETKEVLLLQVERTLNGLKGRENELKSQMEEISLIKQRLKGLSDDIIATIKQQLQQLEQKVHQKLKAEFDKYDRQIDAFYREYNSVNDYLRQNLLQIIDGEISLHSFSKRNLCRDIDVQRMPQFGKIKLVMQKCKKYLKNVKESTKQLQNSIRFFSNEQEKSHLKFQKYDKFLKQKTYTQESNMPFLRTLHMLQEHQPDLSLLRARMRT